jgi:LPXTG-motif cell wall-anchored protein
MELTPAADEEGMDTNTLLLIGMGVVLVVLLLTVVMGKKKK